MINIGIIGIGNSGTQHLLAYKDLKNGKLSSAYDIDKKKLEKVKEIFPDCNIVSSLDEFLDSDIQLVDLCVPSYENLKIVKKILEHKKHILCDIPLSYNIEDAKNIAELANKSDVKFMAARISEFSSNYQVFKNIIDRGKIGEAGFLRASLGGGYPDSYRSWLDDDRSGGGVIVNLGVHLFFYITRLFGRVERVYARRKKVLNGTNKKDYALIVMRFKNKNIAHVELSWAYPDGNPYILKLDAFGTNGQILYDDSQCRPIRIYDNRNNEKDYSLYRIDNPLAGNPYLLQMENFINSIEYNKGTASGLEEDIYVLEIAFACLKSSEENSVVYI